jgi:tetraacyldisaccharide 4'-kinase
MFRARLESMLNRTWYGDRPPGRLLRLLERLYRLGFAWRQRVAARKVDSGLMARPIVIVGNLTAGGTGKTPLVIHLCKLLQSHGLSPGVISRGYGRKSKRLIVIDGSQAVSDVGDEPWLIHERTGAPVAVGARRTEAARRLFREGVDVVISDDGLQHLRLPRTYEICVIDGKRGLGNGRLLPAGPLREDSARLARVDAVIIHQPAGTGLGLPEGVPMTLAAGLFHRLDDDSTLDLAAWQARIGRSAVDAVAGIGHPQRFFDLLDRLGISHRPRVFPDHHAYTARDFTGPQNTLLMTEKDAVKCRELDLGEAWYLPVSASLPAAWEQSFLLHVGQNTRHAGNA